MTRKDHHIIRQLREEGLTLERIAQAYGVRRETISLALAYQVAPCLLPDGKGGTARQALHRRHYRKKCGLPVEAKGRTQLSAK